jgi:hypothetical protein
MASLFSSNKANIVSEIDVNKIAEVKKGIQTDVLQKGGLLDPNCCLSIVTDDRTLDLVMETSTERNKIVKGLKVILEGKNVKFV